MGAFITYRLAFGPNAGRKALTLQAVPVRTEPRKGSDLVTKQAGFSLHAGIACKSYQRKKLECLCSYITRPAIAERRLSLANNGNVVIALNTPYDDGTTLVVLSPMEFMGRRVAVLVPKPRGAFRVIPQNPLEEQESSKPKAYLMTWAQRLKRVFAIEIQKCEKCGGSVRIIASVEDPDAILTILIHLGGDQPRGPLIRSLPPDQTAQQTALFANSSTSTTHR